MDKKKLTDFLIVARAATYASGTNKVTPAFPGSKQYEFRQGSWLYRDFYNQGNRLFMGLETIYFDNKPAWSNCYYGNFSKMTEEEIDKILRQALIENKDKARLWFDIEWKKDGYTYLCKSDFNGDIDEIAGSEEIYRGKEKVYFFYYAGGFIGDNS